MTGRFVMTHPVTKPWQGTARIFKVGKASGPFQDTKVLCGVNHFDGDRI